HAAENPCPLAVDAAAEKAFVDTVAAADALFERAVEPAYETYDQDTEPHRAIFETARAQADLRLERQHIDADEHKRLITNAGEKFKTATQQAREALMAVVKPAEAARTATINDASRAFEAATKKTHAPAQALHDGFCGSCGAVFHDKSDADPAVCD